VKERIWKKTGLKYFRYQNRKFLRQIKAATAEMMYFEVNSEL